MQMMYEMLLAEIQLCMLLIITNADNVHDCVRECASWRHMA